jgi:hypothetical protein
MRQPEDEYTGDKDGYTLVMFLITAGEYTVSYIYINWKAN